MPVPHLEIHRGVQLHFVAIPQCAAQDMLLQHTVSGRSPADDVVAQAGHGAVQARKHLQAVVYRLLEQVIVVPDERSALTASGLSAVMTRS
jgi:hypothetical protein